MKPIIFCEASVQATLENRKTKTRRVIMPQPHDMPEGAYIDPYNKNYEHFTAWTADNRMCLGCGGSIRGAAHWKPRYLPGDILWVRETWKQSPRKDGVFAYKADKLPEPAGCQYLRWRSPIHMPRAAARLFLRVTDVRVERLQEISEEDAKAEGIRSYWLTKEAGKNADDWRESSGPPFIGAAKEMGADLCTTRRGAYRQLWDSLNAKRGFPWKANPWVFVYSFEPISREAAEAAEAP